MGFVWESNDVGVHMIHMQFDLYICFVCICVDVLYLVVDQNECEIEIENSNIIYLVYIENRNMYLTCIFHGLKMYPDCV